MPTDDFELTVPDLYISPSAATQTLALRDSRFRLNIVSTDVIEATILTSKWMIHEDIGVVRSCFYVLNSYSMSNNYQFFHNIVNDYIRGFYIKKLYL